MPSHMYGYMGLNIENFNFTFHHPISGFDICLLWYQMVEELNETNNSCITYIWAFEYLYRIFKHFLYQSREFSSHRAVFSDFLFAAMHLE